MTISEFTGYLAFGGNGLENNYHGNDQSFDAFRSPIDIRMLINSLRVILSNNFEMATHHTRLEVANYLLLLNHGCGQVFYPSCYGKKVSSLLIFHILVSVIFHCPVYHLKIAFVENV